MGDRTVAEGLLAVVERLRQRGRGHYHVELTEEEFQVLDPSGRVHSAILWEDVRRVMAYKVDAFTVDCVYFGFETSQDPGRWLCVSEEVAGFEDLEERLPAVLPGFDQHWRKKVILPAFARNLTVVFSREQSSRQGATA